MPEKGGHIGVRTGKGQSGSASRIRRQENVTLRLKLKVVCESWRFSAGVDTAGLSLKRVAPAAP